MGDFYMKERQNDNIIFLNIIYQNAYMGVIGIDSVIGKVKDEKLAKVMGEQRSEYETICSDAKSILLKYGAQEESISKIKEMSTKMMSKMMAEGKDDKGLAKLLLQGNEKGIVEAQENLNQYKGNDSEIIKLAKRLLATEEHNRDEMKEFI